MFNKALTIRQGQAHGQRHWRHPLERVESGSPDPSFAATHRMPLDKAAEGYKLFLEKREGVMKIVLEP